MSVRQSRTWRQGIFTPNDQLLITAFLVVQAISRGLDYLLGRMGSSEQFVVVNAAFTPSVWGLMFLVGGVVVLIGVFIRLHIVVWLGHTGLAFCFLALTIAFLQPFMFYPENPLAFWTMPILFVSIIIALISWRRGARKVLIGAIAVMALVPIVAFIQSVVLSSTIGDISVRAPALTMSQCVFHALLALRTGPRPLHPKDRVVTREVIVQQETDQ